MKVWLVWKPDSDPYTADILVDVCASEDAANRAIDVDIAETRGWTPRGEYRVEEHDVTT